MLDPKFFTTLSEFVFLDTASLGPDDATSYLFLNPRKHIIAQSYEEVPQCLDRMEEESRRFWLAGYMRYEAAFGLDVKFNPPAENHLPLIWFGVYEKPAVIDKVNDCQCDAPLVRLNPQMKFADYARVIRSIKKQIFLGNTYQVNYTFDFLIQAFASPEFLYFFLRRHQATPYTAFIRNSLEEVLSFSPELFFRHEGERICTRPMKGTASRRIESDSDSAQQERLRHDQKNRAENLMIVDLLRNDLGRICKAGSVQVPSLYDIETHPTVHQMTSTIEGILREDVGCGDIFKALFPCGSVTGAPKVKTMDIISEIEEGRRGIYCGALGYISPARKAVFSVPIRILQKERSASQWQYRAGSGIVWDSKIRSEWEEVMLKTSFLTCESPSDFELVETMRWDGAKILFEKEHLSRLLSSSKFFSFGLKINCLKAYLLMLKKSLSPGQETVIRLLLNQAGKLRHECRDMEPALEKACVRFSEIILDSKNEFLKHKTSYRPWYAKAMERIKNKEIWDEIFFNQHGQVCEGARSNIFIKKGGRLWTPPANCGLLDGLYRQKLLNEGGCREKALYQEDILEADSVYCGNSVRGLQEVVLV
ncbi:MAG: aminodeoxychorismate synthase component I [Candidatus Omnitrophota bacterium]